MKKCSVSKCALTFGLGLLAGVILPYEWIAVIAVVALVIVAVRTLRCGRTC